ncbi:MAG: 6-bladed beta-propeller [Verrucomicrobia bacterium]|nr:MAG: 6-bladed beta-propeller [Verrucomicrobiota bacterium]
MHWRSKFKIFVTGLAAVLLVSCAGTATTAARFPTRTRVWPNEPEGTDEPRIAFVQDLRGPRDVGRNPSAFRAFANWITGDTGENLNLRKPFAVALDEAGNLCLTDTDDKLVCYADFTHKQWRRYAKVGKVRFASPVAVARRNGIFYVADSELGKIFAFGDDGKPLFEIAAPLQRPVGLAIDGGSLYVVDSQAHGVFVFGLDGKFQFQFGRRGDGPGEFNFPTCIAVNGRGQLIVTDTMNSRVQVFDLRGNFVSQFGSNGDTSGHFARPKGVAADSAGRIYVVDAIFDNFQIFNPEGQLLLNVGQSGAGPGGFALPNGIAISADNRIFVADAFNHRVQIFKYIGQP